MIGGSGVISSACASLAVRRGFEVSVLNRAVRTACPGTRQLTADVHDEASVAGALEGTSWDVVVDFLAYGPADVERALRLFRGRAGQYFLISSASAYQRPVRHYRVTEETPLENAFWEYSRAKIAAEQVLTNACKASKFPGVIIRPSLTYGQTQFTLPVNSWARSYTAVDRMRSGRPVIIPGDGSSLWTITHNTDFAKGLVGLFGQERAIGEAFHITSDEVLTWNQYYEAVARAAGVGAPNFVHIASDFLIACAPEMIGTLLGDKAVSVVMDNSKIKRFVPEFACTTPYAVGIAQTMAWFDADPARRLIDPAANDLYDRILGAYQAGLDAAKSLLRP